MLSRNGLLLRGWDDRMETLDKLLSELALSTVASCGICCWDDSNKTGMHCAEELWEILGILAIGGIGSGMRSW